MSAILYIEGGGDNRRLGAQFRKGWNAFFTRAGLGGRMPRVIRGGSRQETFGRFTTALGDSKVPWYSSTPPCRQRKPSSRGQLGLAASEETRLLGSTQRCRRRSGLPNVSGYGDLVSGRPSCIAEIFRRTVCGTRIQAMATVGRSVQGNGSRCICEGYRKLLETLCQGESRIRIACANRFGARRSRLPARKESPGQTESFLTGSRFEIRYAGGRQMSAVTMKCRHLMYFWSLYLTNHSKNTISSRSIFMSESGATQIPKPSNEQDFERCNVTLYQRRIDAWNATSVD